MKCYGRSAIVCAIALLGTSVARAQTTAPPVPPHQISLEFTVGPTLGHTSSVSVGGEADYVLRPKIDLFVEGAHIGNAATSDFKQRGQTIANSVGASVSGVQRVNFLDFGARYHLPDFNPTIAKVHPYVAAGLGFASVKNTTTFSVNGTTVPPESLGVQEGSDLSGTHNRPFLMLGIGTHMPLRQRYFLDISYRYGHAFSASEDGEEVLAGVNTNRIQFGFGLYF
jgi:opacity protein-like surface antigen